MGPENEKGEKFGFWLINISEYGNPGQPIQVPVEASLDGKTFTAKVKIGDYSAEATVEREPRADALDNASYAVTAAIEKIEQENDIELDWFVS